MTAYATERDYETYLGHSERIIPDGSFLAYAVRASARIRQYTMGNIGDNIPDSVKYCCCELAEVLYDFDKGQSAGGVASEKVGDISVSYESADSRRQTLSKTIKSVIYSWLADTGLLYRGGRLC